MSPLHAGTGIDVIVRFHDPARQAELQRAVLSLVGQEHGPIRVLLVLQRFTDDAAAAVRAGLAPLLALPGAPELSILRFAAPEPPDARSALVSMGMAAATGRYLAILDYDDVLYPEAYRLLIDRLTKSDAAIAFAGIVVRHVDVHEFFPYIRGALQPFLGSRLSDLFRQNFCPIHSFVVDRSRVDEKEMRFEEELTLEEDYEFLLRICARHRADFSLIGIKIGEYYFKSDESNTLAGRASVSDRLRARVAEAQAFISGRRHLLRLSEPVQKDLGLPGFDPGLTVAGYLARPKP